MSYNTNYKDKQMIIRLNHEIQDLQRIIIELNGYIYNLKSIHNKIQKQNQALIGENIRLNEETSEHLRIVDYNKQLKQDIQNTQDIQKNTIEEYEFLLSILGLSKQEVQDIYCLCKPLGSPKNLLLNRKLYLTPKSVNKLYSSNSLDS